MDTKAQTARTYSPPRQNFIIASLQGIFSKVDPCPNGQTLQARCVELRCTAWTQVPCKQWACPYCSRRKIARLARLTKLAAPNRMLTLTVDPGLWENPRAAFDGTRRQVPELIRRLRKDFGEIEYLRATELTKNGWPHYHLLIRSGFLPHKVVQRIWAELTGAIIVDLRQVKQTFSAYTYLVKYLSKLHKIEWTERHLSYSKNFFPKEEKEEPPQQTYTFDAMRILHRSLVLMHYDQHRGRALVWLTGNWHTIDTELPEGCPELAYIDEHRVKMVASEVIPGPFDPTAPNVPPSWAETYTQPGLGIDGPEGF